MKTGKQWVEYFLGLLLAYVWAKEKPKLQKAVEQTKMKLPLEAFSTVAEVIPHIVDGLKAGHAPADIMATVKKNFVPEALSLAESGLNMLIPGAGTILGLIVWMHENSKTMTQEETNAWMDRSGAGSQS